jgi:hypothetical protein
MPMSNTLPQAPQTCSGSSLPSTWAKGPGFADPSKIVIAFGLTFAAGISLSFFRNRNATLSTADRHASAASSATN